MKIGYGKLGRSMPLTLEKCGNLGGDVEMVAVVKQLAERHPNDTFYLLGKNSGEEPQSVGLPANVLNPWVDWKPRLRRAVGAFGLDKGLPDVHAHEVLGDIMRELTRPMFVEMDAHIWWVGQHGTTNSPLPSIRDPLIYTKPFDWCAHYAAFILQGLNAWQDADLHANARVFSQRREPVWLNADPRNRHKMRDIKFPLQHPILTQFNFENEIKHEQYDGTTPILSQVKNVYSRLEVNGLAPGTPFGSLLDDAGFRTNWTTREPFGLFINEARKIGVAESRQRFTALRDWVLPLDPAFIHGTWSAESQAQLGRRITPAPWDRYIPTLQSVRCTLTTPSSGSGWATTKPWEAFAAGTVCFFHPGYDTQNNILQDAETVLREYLRVKTPAELKEKVAHLDNHPEFWYRLIAAQRQHFENALQQEQWQACVEERIW